jgi:hypothetical protein
MPRGQKRRIPERVSAMPQQLTFGDAEYAGKR